MALVKEDRKQFALINAMVSVLIEKSPHWSIC